MGNNTTKVLQRLRTQINTITSNLIYYDWYYFISNNIKFIIDIKIIYIIFINVFYCVIRCNYIVSKYLIYFFIRGGLCN